LIEKREGKGVAGRSGNGWENYIWISHKDGVSWNNLAYDRAPRYTVVNIVMDFKFP